MTDLKCLTTKEVARLCRVSDATVKRWDDAGVLQSERTNGGHRRFRAEEVARFQHKQKLGLKQSHGDESVVAASIRRSDNRSNSSSSFYHALVTGSEESATDTLIGEYLRGETLAAIFDRLICPAMHEIGERWYKGELSVAKEHLATRTATSAIQKLRSRLPVPETTDKIAVCCTAENDFHEFPIHLAQITIENEGWEVMNFGSNMPLYSLAEEVLQHSPSAICISATIISDFERLGRDYKDFREQTAKQKIPIVLGGGGFKDERIRARFPAEIYAKNFTELAEFIENLKAD